MLPVIALVVVSGMQLALLTAAPLDENYSSEPPTAPWQSAGNIIRINAVEAVDDGPSLSAPPNRENTSTTNDKREFSGNDYQTFDRGADFTSPRIAQRAAPHEDPQLPPNIRSRQSTHSRSPASRQQRAPRILQSNHEDPGPQAEQLPEPIEPGLNGHYEEPPVELPSTFEPVPYGRFEGRGEPLIGASWQNRPFFAGVFIGGFDGDTLVDGEINQGVGFMSGIRLGWDYDTYWGVETRLAFVETGLDFLNAPWIDSTGNQVILWDGSLVYYPWGDSRWRPYIQAGVGLLDNDFVDNVGFRRSEAVLSVPWGFGLKYRQTDWITMRLDFTDNVAFGGKAGYVSMMNNLSLSGGVEFRLGGVRKSYYPWNPSAVLR
ncbi:MAG: hypothetical protein SGJ20_04655 [Planctomycetota bacterium]|nr:hypothetical protein [Planctomycetota bacterium]